jgi:acyl-CoA dehydrogenase
MQRSKAMDFSLGDEQKMVQQTVRDFVNRELILLEGDVLRNELPIERWYRLVRLYRIFEGTDEIQRYIISRNLLRGHVAIGEALS